MDPKPFSCVDSPAPQRVRISWELLTPPDPENERPDSNDDGFWPSLDPESAGYIGLDATDIDGTAQQAKWEEQHDNALARLHAWQAGDWHYIGVVARAHVFIPIGGGSFRVLALDSAGLWGIESDSDDSHIRETFGDERAGLLEQLRTLGHALGSEPDFAEELPEGMESE